MKLDLGGTACYESKDAVNINLDATDAGDEITPMIIADYNCAPFVDNIFDEAFGSCYLEERPNFHELYRIMKKGAIVKVKSCDRLYDDEDVVVKEIEDAGFEIIERSAYIEDYGYDEPWVLRSK